MYVILAMNSSRQAQLFGTPTSRPFTGEASAGKAARRIHREFPDLDTLVLPISKLPPEADSRYGLHPRGTRSVSGLLP